MANFRQSKVVYSHLEKVTFRVSSAPDFLRLYIFMFLFLFTEILSRSDIVTLSLEKDMPAVWYKSGTGIPSLKGSIPFAGFKENFI